MKTPPFFLAALSLITLGSLPSFAAEETPDRVPIRLASSPALSPDGKRIAFSWAGDLWTARSRGGDARQITSHPAYDNGPAFSPDGAQIAFTSNRTGQDQVFVMPVDGGIPRQVTFHSEGSRLVEWYPDGQSLLTEGTRDFGTRSATRFYRIDLTERGPEALLFDAEGSSPALSPDGKRLLFCREGSDLYRKGYRGSKASQIWLAEGLETGKPVFRRLIARDTEARSPMWKPDGSGFYYLGDQGEAALFDVYEHDLKSGEETALTTFSDDPAINPGIARDGSVIVFRKEFEFFRLPLGEDVAKPGPKLAQFHAASDTLPNPLARRTLTRANNVTFSADGLEMAFTAGGDVWVMDTELREPVAVTQTPAEEREPVLSADGNTLYFVRDEGTEADIWAATRANPRTYWWRNVGFKETRLTTDGSTKTDLQVVPGGKRLSWVAGGGDLWSANADGKDAKRLIESWNVPQYDWSPDGQWLAWAVSDDDFNRDVWIGRADGKGDPYNLSRHPDSDGDPHWSPNGKMLAFTGRRFETETDIYYVHLSLADEEKDKRDRTLESALEKLDKARKKPEPPASPTPAAPPASPPAAVPATPAVSPKPDDAPSANPAQTPPPTVPAADAKPATPEAPKPPAKPEPPKLPEVKIDFDRLSDRIHRISIPDTAESGLFWSHDSKKLAFAAEIKGVKGTYTVSFPDPGTPSLIAPKQGGLAKWVAKDDSILWLVEGLPSSLSKGVLKGYSFTARQSYETPEYWRTGFRQIWRTMRDQWYDGNLNHRDWNAVLAKYEDAAAESPDTRAFDRVVAMMLGELNGSHLGFKSAADTTAFKPAQSWTEETAHLGVTFDRFFAGPGWKVASVIPKGPADHTASRLHPGDIILEIDGLALTRDTDPTTVLNGIPARDIRLKLAPAAPVSQPDEKAGDQPEKATGEKEAAPAKAPAPREVTIRPIPYARARELMQAARIEARRDQIDRLSEGRIGYVSVAKMDWNEFIRFEEEIYARGHGKEGLIIDVRDNGGGFTADHLLTVLTPAEHAVTVPRGGGPGYPQDRRVYATWNKPITVLCNQNSFSNAEIFSHAVKELGRGKLVGVPTAGGVVSTGSTAIMDLGLLRLPFRGWYRKSDGADMELNGAVPDEIVWPEPGDEAAGQDRQIEKGVALLLKDIDAEKAKPAPKLIPASERGKR